MLFRNEHLLVLNKPYDVPVQAGAHGSQTPLAALVAGDHAFRQQGGASLSFRAAPLHRLDRRTTGVLVCSQSLAGAQWFSAALREHRLQKRYVALLCGTLTGRCTWSDDIGGKQARGGTFRTVTVSHAGDDAGGRVRHAVTDVAPLAYGSWRGEAVTLSELVIHTGRTHQIRAQAAAHGHALLGDTAYGGTPLHGFAESLLLHARELRLPPDAAGLGLPPQFQAPLPPEAQKILSATLKNWGGRLIL